MVYQVNMEGSEQVLATIEGLRSDDLTTYYNLVLTTRRIVLVHTPDLPVNPEIGLAKGGLIGGLVGHAVAEAIDGGVESKRKEKENSQNLTLDDLLRKDNKSFAIDHEEVTEIKIHKGWIDNELIIESGGSQKIFLVEHNIKKVSKVLLQASPLAGKVTVSRSVRL
jgi:hypothetical protein